MADEAKRGLQLPSDEVKQKTKVEGGKGDSGDADVEGQSAPALRRCWNCGGVNRVNPLWDYFICGNCGTWNWM